MKFYCVESRFHNGEHISKWTRHSWHWERSGAERNLEWMKNNPPSPYADYRIVVENRK